MLVLLRYDASDVYGSKSRVYMSLETSNGLLGGVLVDFETQSFQFEWFKSRGYELGARLLFK